MQFQWLNLLCSTILLLITDVWPLKMLGCKNIYLKDILLFRFADHILVGDEVLVEGNDKFTPLRVVNITNIMMQGHYHNLSD